MKFKAVRKKPVIVHAAAWDGSTDGPIVTPVPDEFRSNTPCRQCGAPPAVHGAILTREGSMVACPGDIIIRGVQGEHYPCKPEIFEKTYEEANTWGDSPSPAPQP